MESVNEFGQPVGVSLGGWRPPLHPSAERLSGRTVQLVAFDADAHGADLFGSFGAATDDLWTYMPWGPFVSSGDLGETFAAAAAQPDWLTYSLIVDGRALGVSSYLRIDPDGGVIEIGGITYGPALQRTVASTETSYVLIRHAFELGYRRVEWKCDNLNAPSRAAARRLGFTFEGVFRKAAHYKHRSRDTAWFAIIDDDWPRIDAEFKRWLGPSNFDQSGEQRTPLRTQAL
ncbi:MAG: GNAT family N-acetyltransferase [Acidimicrobiales bacterium]